MNKICKTIDNIRKSILAIGRRKLYMHFAYILILITVITRIVLFSIESNKVQSHQLEISIEPSETLILDSLNVKIEYPNYRIWCGINDESSIIVTIYYLFNGNIISSLKPKKYFLKSNYLLYDVLANLRTNTRFLIDDKPGIKKKIRKDSLKSLYDYILIQDGSIHNDSIAYDEYFFIKNKDKSYYDKIPATDIITYNNYNPSILSPYNLQKRHLALKINTPLPKDKISVDVDFKMPINLHSLSKEPDIKRIKSISFNNKETIEYLNSEFLYMLVETLPYEGIQTLRNIIIGFILPILISYLTNFIIKDIKKIKENYAKHTS